MTNAVQVYDGCGHYPDMYFVDNMMFVLHCEWQAHYKADPATDQYNSYLVMTGVQDETVDMLLRMKEQIEATDGVSMVTTVVYAQDERTEYKERDIMMIDYVRHAWNNQNQVKIFWWHEDEQSNED